MGNTFLNTRTNSNTNLQNSNQNMIENDIKTQCACTKSIQYKKMATSGNDPTISKKMQYASYVRTYGVTQSYNVGSKTFSNIGVIPELTREQKILQNVQNGIIIGNNTPLDFTPLMN
jgi:hypothetical protein